MEIVISKDSFGIAIRKTNYEVKSEDEGQTPGSFHESISDLLNEDCTMVMGREYVERLDLTQASMNLGITIEDWIPMKEAVLLLKAQTIALQYETYSMQQRIPFTNNLKRYMSVVFGEIYLNINAFQFEKRIHENGDYRIIPCDMMFFLCFGMMWDIRYGYRLGPDRLITSLGLSKVIGFDAHLKAENNNDLDERKYSKQNTYLMVDNNTGLHKIGKSKDIMKREKTLQSEKPTIRLVHTFFENIERRLHKRYAHKRVRGEWFDLSSADLSEIISNN